MEEMVNVQRCVQSMIEIDQIVGMERQINEKIAKHVRQICERNVYHDEVMKGQIRVEMGRQMSERIVILKIVQELIGESFDVQIRVNL